MADLSKYRIHASPQYETVSPGATVNYWCQQTYDLIEAIDSPRDQFQWFCVNDPVVAKKFGRPYVFKGPARVIWEKAEWVFAGRHVVQCHVRFTDGARHVYEHIQTVESSTAIVTRELERLQREDTASPSTTRSVLLKHIQLLKDIEKSFPIKDPSKKKEHDNLIAGYEAYYAKLDEVLKPTDGAYRFPVRAVHLDAESQARSPLKIFVARLGAEVPERWVLVDWTNPTDRTQTSHHEATGASSREAIEKLVAAWSSGGNRYPPGLIRYEVPNTATGGFVLKGDFETTGKTNWDRLSGALEWVGLAAAGVAIVVCLVAPVPGSSLISAAIWMSVFSSTAASVINIGQRHEEGFGNWREDAFDTLTIAGNLFAGAGMWAKGATVLARNAQGKLLRGVLIGQVATDGVQGVLVATEHIQQYDAIMSDESLLPDERARKLLELLRSLAIAGALTYISAKGTLKDLDNLNKPPKHLPVDETKAPITKLEDLADPTKEIDTTKPPKVEATIEDGKSVAKIQVTQERVAPKRRRSPFEEKFNREQGWAVFDIKADAIHLEHYEHGVRWKFKATNKSGVVKISVLIKETDKIRSSRLKGHQIYKMMFEHFELNGLPVKQWSGQLAFDNYSAIKKAMAAPGATAEKAVLESPTGKFWKEWADSKNLQVVVDKATDYGPDQFEVRVMFEPRSGRVQ